MAAKKFTKTSAEAFKSFVIEAGMILNKFDVESPNVQDSDIICATTGGITASCVPTYLDLGEDVDNCPKNLKELKKLDSWDCKLAFTSLSTTKEAIQMALGASEVTSEKGLKVAPRRDLKPTDFKDVWWVGDRVDGGMVAICLKNALSTSGLSLKTTKNGKGQLQIELTGHVSAAAQDTMPMEFYSTDGSLPAAASAGGKK